MVGTMEVKVACVFASCCQNLELEYPGTVAMLAPATREAKENVVELIWYKGKSTRNLSCSVIRNHSLIPSALTSKFSRLNSTPLGFAVVPEVNSTRAGCEMPSCQIISFSGALN